MRFRPTYRYKISVKPKIGIFLAHNNWVVPEKIHTCSMENISAIQGARGEECLKISKEEKTKFV